MTQSDIEIIAWLVMGVGLMAAEILAPGFVLFPFGIGALAAAFVSWTDANFGIQFLTFVVVSAVALIALRPLAKRMNKVGSAAGVGAVRLVGREATVTQAIDGDIGMIHFEGESWRAESIDGSHLAAGSKVLIVDVVGTRVRVTPAETINHEEA